MFTVFGPLHPLPQLHDHYSQACGLCLRGIRLWSRISITVLCLGICIARSLREALHQRKLMGDGAALRRDCLFRSAAMSEQFRRRIWHSHFSSSDGDAFSFKVTWKPVLISDSFVPEACDVHYSWALQRSV